MSRAPTRSESPEACARGAAGVGGRAAAQLRAG
jgi:hypothetical protein